jgi:hypothetical protein
MHFALNKTPSISTASVSRGIAEIACCPTAMTSYGLVGMVHSSWFSLLYRRWSVTQPLSNVTSLLSHRALASSTRKPTVTVWPTTLMRSSVTGFLALERAVSPRIALMPLSRLAFWCGAVAYQRARTVNVEFHRVATS